MYPVNLALDITHYIACNTINDPAILITPGDKRYRDEAIEACREDMVAKGYDRAAPELSDSVMRDVFFNAPNIVLAPNGKRERRTG